MKFNLKEISVKARINKCNNQINISIPRKQITKGLIDKATSGKVIKLLFEED